MSSVLTGTRGVADFLIGHTRAGINTAGQIVLLAIDAATMAFTSIIRGEFSWDEFFEQAWFMTRVSLLPAILVSIPFGVIVSVQVGGVAKQIGAESFIGARQRHRRHAPSGTVGFGDPDRRRRGAAVTADLGARAVREELDALRVMGVHPVQRLAAPRVVAAVLVGICLSAVVATTAIITGYMIVVGGGSVSSGTYLGAFISFGQPLDIFMAVLKAIIFGFVAVVVAAHKGMNASGGPKGVADAVNQSVVLSVILLAMINVGITQVYVMLIPQRLA